MSKKFNATYGVDDGYAGGSRPQHFTIHADDLDDDMTDEELQNFFHESMQEHFEQTVSPYAKNSDDFVAWAREQLEERGDEQ